MTECKQRSGVNWWDILHSLGTLCFIYASLFHTGYPDTPWFYQQEPSRKHMQCSPVLRLDGLVMNEFSFMGHLCK